MPYQRLTVRECSFIPYNDEATNPDTHIVYSQYILPIVAFFTAAEKMILNCDLVPKVKCNIEEELVKMNFLQKRTDTDVNKDAIIPSPAAPPINRDACSTMTTPQKHHMIDMVFTNTVIENVFFVRVPLHKLYLTSEDMECVNKNLTMLTARTTKQIIIDLSDNLLELHVLNNAAFLCIAQCQQVKYVLLKNNKLSSSFMQNLIRWDYLDCLQNKMVFLPDAEVIECAKWMPKHINNIMYTHECFNKIAYKC